MNALLLGGLFSGGQYCDISAILLKLVASRQTTVRKLRTDRLMYASRWALVPVSGQCTATYLPSLPSLPPPLTVARRVTTAGGRWRRLGRLSMCLSMGIMAVWPLQHGETGVHAC